MVSGFGVSPDVIWSLVWAGFAPPKAEIFAWRVLWKRVPVKVELLKRGMISVGSSCCPFCFCCEETVHHLFFSCHVAYGVWMRCCGLWNISTVLPCEPKLFLAAWLALMPNKFLSNFWHMVFFAVLWSLWLFRNDIVFKGVVLDINQLCDVLFWRLGTWCKACWDEVTFSLSHFIADPSIFSPPLESVNYKTRGGWAAPNYGCVKFNVDASICGVSRAVGIGGVLRDHDGLVLIRFTKSVGMIDIGLAEFLAVREALVIFHASKWFGGKDLIVETDCLTVVNWLRKPLSAPVSMRSVVVNTVKMGAELKWVVKHVKRELNGEADGLAKVAARRKEDLLIVS